MEYAGVGEAVFERKMLYLFIYERVEQMSRIKYYQVL